MTLAGHPGNVDGFGGKQARDERSTAMGQEERMTDPSAVSPESAAGFRFRQMLPTLVFDVAMPIVAFNLLARSGVPILWALVAGGVFPAINNLRAWAKSRRLEPLGIIVMAFLAIGTATSLISGSVFFALIKDSFLTASFGFICLGSLLAERPLMFHIIQQFVAGDDPVRLEWWKGLSQYPDFRAGLRFVTAVWGIAYLVEALLRVGFALVLSPAQVVVISPVMAFGAMIVLIAWTRRHLRALRERRKRERLPSQAG
jgi:intracellular septation protein A